MLFDLFEETTNRRICPQCNKPMPRSTKDDLCPACQDELLFRQVRDYINKHHTTEIQLADHFDIPLQKVRSWIKDGRIEYRDLQ